MGLVEYRCPECHGKPGSSARVISYLHWDPEAEEPCRLCKKPMIAEPQIDEQIIKLLNPEDNGLRYPDSTPL
jgi:hypothetical protein